MTRPRSADIVPIEILRMVTGTGLEAVSKPKKRSQLRPKQQALLVAAYAGAEQALEAERIHPGIMYTTRNYTACLLQSQCARIAADAGQIRELKDGSLEATFDDKERAQYAAATVAARILHPRKFRWIDPPAYPEALQADARIAVFGDWATGLYGAPLVADSIRRDPVPFDLVIHLGDTYYAGQKFEVEDRLVRFWPFRDGAVNRSLNGNHEMYSNGRPYIDMVRKHFDQRSSCFWMQNEDWVLIGLDTSYNGFILPSHFDLNESQIQWLLRVITQAEKRKIVLFSHHYPFSAFEDGGSQLRKTLRGRLPQGQFFAWYWGHEHRCAIYDWSPEWKLFGRCIGHGGFPYFRDGSIAPPGKSCFRERRATEGAPRCIVLDGINSTVTDHQYEYGPHGYLTLELHGKRLTERVHEAADRREIWAQELTNVNRKAR
jgi:hypothetical protein